MPSLSSPRCSRWLWLCAFLAAAAFVAVLCIELMVGPPGPIEADHAGTMPESRSRLPYPAEP